MSPVIEKIQAHPLTQKAMSYVPFVAFIGGFGFDIATLGKGVKWVDFLLLSSYTLLCTILLVAQTRRWFEKWANIRAFALQFGLGALFSAMVVLYFKSSGQWLTLIFVVLLFVAMVANEFLHKYENLREIIWGIYAVSVTMVLNFIIPHAADSVSPQWFYLSSLVALGVVVLVWWASAAPKMLLRGPGIAMAFLVVSYFFGWIPPVPLIKENGLVCTDFVKATYTCNIDTPGWKQKLGFAPVVSKDAGESVQCLTAVSAPPGAVAKLEHRWYQDVDGSWVLRDTMSFEMTGGRKRGWRFWSGKRNPAPGMWKVETALKGGAVLTVQKMKVVEPRKASQKQGASL